MQEKKLLLEKNGPRLARISVFEVCNHLTLDQSTACPLIFLTRSPSLPLACLDLRLFIS
jgi:hypothetical protein